MKKFAFLFLPALVILTPIVAKPADNANPKDDFVDLHDIDPTIIIEMRYYGDHNFIEKPVKGYKEPKCLLTKETAQALSSVQKKLKRRRSLSLRVYDCYRPQKAVDQFARWAKNLKDTKMKEEFYPTVGKEDLFKEGYIAEKSGHSRGSTVDVTINGLDMGTPFDFFSPLSHTASPQIGTKQLGNRLKLKKAMEKQGFVNLKEEWWHYTLKDEPYPNQYFNFDVK